MTPPNPPVPQDLHTFLCILRLHGMRVTLGWRINDDRRHDGGWWEIRNPRGMIVVDGPVAGVVLLQLPPSGYSRAVDLCSLENVRQAISLMEMRRPRPIWDGGSITIATGHSVIP